MLAEHLEVNLQIGGQQTLGQEIGEQQARMCCSRDSLQDKFKLFVIDFPSSSYGSNFDRVYVM